MTLRQRAARSLLSDRWYVDEDILNREIALIFRKAWHYVGCASQVTAVGDYFTTTIAQVPVVVVRSSESSVAAHVNICAHRGHEVAAGEGHCDALRCAYHGWTYALDGRLAAAPRITGAAAHGLRPLHLVAWGPLFFVTLSKTPLPFSDWLGDIPSAVVSNGVDVATLAFEQRIPWTFEANWKVGIENFLECYHCHFVHPSLSEALDVRPTTYRLLTSAWSSTQVAAPGRKAAEIVGSGRVTTAQFHYLWPSTTLTINPGPPNLWVNAWHPDGCHRTTGFGDIFFDAATDQESRAKMMSYNATVSLEDDSIVASVQRGLRSGMFPVSLLAEEEESLIQHFQELVLAETALD
jgi:phenylpropionate dioxygenase-like ring-hydroxylating dioxygenase large terminal subunit